MVKRLVIVLMVFIGYGEDEPKKVKPKEVEVDLHQKMGLIPEGAITVDDEMVNVNAFYMDKYEVTVGQFKEFVKRADYEYDLWDDVAEYSPTDSHPMIELSWYDAKAYAWWADKRLPTEVEWEYAARGGLVDKRFPWGDDGNVARDYANYAGDWWQGSVGVQTAPVGSLKPNSCGLFDMAGNASDWCQDWYDSGKDTKVLRGGSWHLNASNLLPLL
ncbi:TPA: hypothetical protein EYG59_15945 [Candidatus Poribacteria bacterium]|nr:hypothetical protein [Candidatus Poribacteria bacterium]